MEKISGYSLFRTNIVPKGIVEKRLKIFEKNDLSNIENNKLNYKETNPVAEIAKAYRNKINNEVFGFNTKEEKVGLFEKIKCSFENKDPISYRRISKEITALWVQKIK